MMGPVWIQHLTFNQIELGAEVSIDLGEQFRKKWNASCRELDEKMITTLMSVHLIWSYC